jgi:uroporphyrinogen-III synthase
MYERLAGKTVVLTRESADNAELAARLRAHAAHVVELPCVRTEPSDDIGALGEALIERHEDDWVVVTSRHGADAVAGCGPTRAAIAAIGDATAERLRARGLRVAFQPSAPNGLTLARELPLRDGIVLLARSDRALPDLPLVLRGRGFTVREAVAYRTIAEAQGDVAAVRTLLASPRGTVAVLFHSPSAVAGMVGAIEAPLIARAAVHCIGGATLRAARAAIGPDADLSLMEGEAAHVIYR